MPELIVSKKSKTAKLNIDDREFELPIVVGSEDEVALNVGKLRRNRIHHLGSWIREYRVDNQFDHVSRRRDGHPPLPRLRGRRLG